jgi:hypothetical protein
LNRVEVSEVAKRRVLGSTTSRPASPGDHRTGKRCPEVPFDVGGEKIKRLDLKNCELFPPEGEANR